MLVENWLAKIVASCPIDSQTTVVEVGSGYGNLTKLLIQTNHQQILSYEKDPKLYFWLKKQKLAQHPSLIFLCQDVLTIDWSALKKKYLKPNSSLLLVGNLPYAIANTLLFSLLKEISQFKALIFLVQKEVAQRWMATPKQYKRDYSAFSVYLRLLTQGEILFTIPKQNFFPIPSVDGSLVYLTNQTKIALAKEKWASFWAFLKNCFRYRRKTLWNNLMIASYQKKKIKLTFQKLNYSTNLRPQQLATQDYLNLFDLLTKNNNSFTNFY